MNTFVPAFCVLLVWLTSPLDAKKLRMMMKEDVPDFGTSAGGRSHPCYRLCDGTRMLCEYNITTSMFTTLSARCGECPWKLEHCSRPGCVVAAGTSRPVYVANLMMPGPALHVCAGDQILVRLVNSFETSGVTLHWHGLWMRGTPHMDGVPYLTQCPVQPNNAFTYHFKAEPNGTHMWHSHLGFLEADGLFGALVVRRPLSEEPSSSLYDEDLPEHTVVIWHWYPHLTEDYLPARLHRNQSVEGAGLLVNGKGRIQPVLAEDGRQAEAPWEEILVEPGKRYRFRLVYNSAVYCPVQLSVDNHTLLAIATDGAAIQPVEVDSVMLNAGERWDVVLRADQPVSSYWIRLRALGDCGQNKSRVHQQAILKYRGSSLTQPTSERPNFENSHRNGTILNPMQVSCTDYSDHELVRVKDLISLERPLHGDISQKPDQTFYANLNFTLYPDLVSPGPYPQMNGISFEFPAIPLLTQRSEVVSGRSFCTEEDAHKNCYKNYCSCPYIASVKLGALVEFVLIDESTHIAMDHPYHLHGSNFHVVAEQTIGGNVSLESIRALNEAGLLTKRFIGAPLKDTVNVPSQGYVVIRFRATNPGYWLWHCHVTNHMHLGMAMVLRVGEHADMAAVPSDFPRCGDWTYQSDLGDAGASADFAAPKYLHHVLAAVLIINAVSCLA